MVNLCGGYSHCLCIKNCERIHTIWIGQFELYDEQYTVISFNLSLYLHGFYLILIILLLFSDGNGCENKMLYIWIYFYFLDLETPMECIHCNRCRENNSNERKYINSLWSYLRNWYRSELWNSNRKELNLLPRPKLTSPSITPLNTEGSAAPVENRGFLVKYEPCWSCTRSRCTGRAYSHRN